MSIIIPPFQALNFDTKKVKCCGNSKFCQIYENTDTPCVQVQLTGNGTDLICQGDFANMFLDADNGTFEDGTYTGLVIGAAIDNASIVGALTPHTGILVLEGLLTGVTGIVVNNSTNITLQAGKKYWLKAWIWLDGWSIGGGDDTIFDIGINCGWVTATTAIIKQVDNTNGIADTWLELITEITVGTTSTGCMQIRVSGHPIDDNRIYIDDLGVTCWEIIPSGVDGDWSHDWINETLVTPATALTNPSFMQEVAITACRWYKLTYTIVHNGSGLSIDFYLGDNNYINRVAPSNSYTDSFFIMAGELHSSLIIIAQKEDVDTTITIDDIILEEISMPAYCIENCNPESAKSAWDAKHCSQYQCEGGYAYEGNDIEIYEDDLGNLWALICPDLTGLDGCYKICIYDTLNGFYGNTLICNGNFDIVTTENEWCWTLGGQAPLIQNGVLHFEHTDNFGGYATQQNGLPNVNFLLKAGCRYILEFDILNYVSGHLFIYINDIAGCGGASIFLGEFTSAGHYAINIDLSLNPCDYGIIRFYDYKFSPITKYTTNFDLDNVKISAISACGETYIPIACTECLCISDTWGCSLLLRWTNDENAFGFEYELSGFVQSLRVRADLGKDNYKTDEDNFRFSDGRREILYADVSKLQGLTIGDMPDYLHAALAIGLKHDDFWIDSVKFICEAEDYTPNWRKTANIAPIEIEVSEASQNLKNNNC